MYLFLLGKGRIVQLNRESGLFGQGCEKGRKTSTHAHTHGHTHSHTQDKCDSLLSSGPIYSGGKRDQLPAPIV